MKDAELYTGIIEKNNVEAVTGGVIFEEFTINKQIAENGFYDASGQTFTEPLFIRSDNGDAETSTSSYGATENYIYCENAECIELKVPINTTTILAGIAFYDKNQVYVSGFARPVDNLAIGVEMVRYKVPSSAYSFRVTYYNTTNRAIYGEFDCKVIYFSTEELKLDNREIVDGQGIAILPEAGDYGSIYSSSMIGCTKYQYCKDAILIKLRVPVLTTSPSQGFVFYDENKDPLQYLSILRSQGGTEGYEDIEIKSIPVNAVYFRTSYWNYANSKIYGEYFCNITFKDGTLGNKKYLPFQPGQIHYRVEVNQAVSNFWDSSAANQESEDFKGSTGVLILPDNYSKDGCPVPVIMWVHGMSRNVTYTE
nr:hypothetical protein [uncultured Draconibacterium sp.]